MTKNYQKKTATTSTTERSPGPVSVPEVVSVAMSEIAADVREGLLALAVGAGLQVMAAMMAAMMAADVDALCGPKGRHDRDRTAIRHGSEAGSVTVGGRRLPVRRPRVRAADGSGELPIASYETFTSTEILGRKAMEQMLPACRPAATPWAWNRSVTRSRPRPGRPASPRSLVGSSRPPSTPCPA